MKFVCGVGCFDEIRGAQMTGLHRNLFRVGPLCAVRLHIPRSASLFFGFFFHNSYHGTASYCEVCMVVIAQWSETLNCAPHCILTDLNRDTWCLVLPPVMTLRKTRACQ